MIDSIVRHLPSDHPWIANIHYFDCVESTNSLAKEMARAGAPHGTVLIADRQTAGRGRLGRSFLSPGKMGIYMSVILRYRCKAEDLMHLTCACGVHLCNAVAPALPTRPRIKWINDLVYDRKKLAGILTELVFTGDEICAVVGIGLNCCQMQKDFDPQIQSIATSVAMITGKQPDRGYLAAQILQELSVMDRQLLTQRQAQISAYKADCMTVGQDVCILQNDTVRYGSALDILPDGALLVRLTDGTEEMLNSGEVSVRGMYGYL